MNLQEYINIYHAGASDWFIAECGQYNHIGRVNDILDKREYLAGKHKINNSPDITYNGQIIKATKIILQYAKTLINFQTSFLLSKPVTLSSIDEATLTEFKNVYSKADYNSIDFKILDKMLKYGQIYEYVYLDGDIITSKLIMPEDSYPVYNDMGNMIAFIEHYTVNGTSYYNIFTEDKVYKYSDKGGDGTFLIGEYINLSGLPCIYKTLNEEDETIGKSELDDWIPILDNIERLISKYMDSFYKYMNPIPVMKGEKLNTGKNREGAISQDVAGFTLQIDNDSEFDFAMTNMDSNSLKEIYSILKQALLDISMTPAISMNSQEISNLSEVSIKILFNLATVKATFNAMYMKEGFKQRWNKIKKLLDYKGITVDGDISCEFEMNIPQNEKEVIENLKMLKDMNVISDISIIEHSPYIYDVAREVERIGEQGKKVEDVKEVKE